MKKKVLIIGPSGSGKTYISTALREKGLNAVDADLVEGLSSWFDGDGNKVSFPKDASPEFMDNHQFLWDREFLEEYLKTQEEIYLFGLSGNIFEMINLFDKVYFLKAVPELLEERLQHENRENPMGKTEYQREQVIAYARAIEEEAQRLGCQMIEANQSPEAIQKVLIRSN